MSFRCRGRGICVLPQGRPRLPEGELGVDVSIDDVERATAEFCALLAEQIASGYRVTEADGMAAYETAFMRAAEYGARRVAEQIRIRFSIEVSPSPIDNRS